KPNADEVFISRTENRARQQENAPLHGEVTAECLRGERELYEGGVAGFRALPCWWPLEVRAGLRDGLCELLSIGACSGQAWRDELRCMAQRYFGEKFSWSAGTHSGVITGFAHTLQELGVTAGNPADAQS